MFIIYSKTFSILSRTPVARSLSLRSYTLLSRLPFYGSNTFLCGASLWLPPYRKMHWYPHPIKLLQKCAIFNEAINMHFRGPMEQHFYIWEPHRGCLNKVKKVRWYPLIREGQQSHKYAFWRVNIAIEMKIALVPPCSVLLPHRLTVLCALTGTPHSLYREDRSLNNPIQSGLRMAKHKRAPLKTDGRTVQNFAR